MVMLFIFSRTGCYEQTGDQQKQHQGYYPAISYGVNRHNMLKDAGMFTYTFFLHALQKAPPFSSIPPHLHLQVF